MDNFTDIQATVIIATAAFVVVGTVALAIIHIINRSRKAGGRQEDSKLGSGFRRS